MKLQVAVIGGCFSRDLFNSVFIPDWKEDFVCTYNAFQTSLLSLTTTPVPYPRSLLNFEGKNYTDKYRNFLVRELNKSFLNDLLSLSPDIIMLDFYDDAVHGVTDIDGKTYLTRQPDDIPNNAVSSFIADSLSSRSFISLKDHDGYMSVWQKAADTFISFLREFLPETRVLLNCPVFADKVLYSDGRIEDFDPPYVKRVNLMHQEMIDYFEHKYENAVLMKLEKSYYADPDYPYGVTWIAHFHKDFYVDSYKLLKQLCSDMVPKKQECRNNLLTNGSFKYRTLFFKYWSRAFYISEEDGEAAAKIDQSGRTKPAWFQVWFNDIPIDGSGQVEYTLCYDVKISSEIPLSHKLICAVRTFRKEGFSAKKDCVEELDFVWDSSRPDEWVHYVHTFRPKGNFMSPGLFCSQNGRISWKNIKLYRCGHEPAPEEALGNITEDLLIGSRKLTDVNYMHLYE